jgi:hypothetical protein
MRERETGKLVVGEDECEREDEREDEIAFATISLDSQKTQKVWLDDSLTEIGASRWARSRHQRDVCCLLVLISVTSTPQWTRQPEPRDMHDVCISRTPPQRAVCSAGLRSGLGFRA